MSLLTGRGILYKIACKLWCKVKIEKFVFMRYFCYKKKRVRE